MSSEILVFYLLDQKKASTEPLALCQVRKAAPGRAAAIEKCLMANAA